MIETVTSQLRTSIGLCTALAALVLIDGGLRADPADEALRLYAVHIVQNPPQEWTGYGIYLGKGLILTAAHVVGSAAKTNQACTSPGLSCTPKP